MITDHREHTPDPGRAPHAITAVWPSKTDILDRQHASYAMLGTLFRRCVTEDLPVIKWEVGTAAYLVGWCTAENPDEQRAEFEAWAKALDLVLLPEVSDAGTVRLCGIRSLTVNAPGVGVGHVTVTVMAELVTDDGARPALLQWHLNPAASAPADGCPTWCGGTHERPWPQDNGATHERDVAEATVNGVPVLAVTVSHWEPLKAVTGATQARRPSIDIYLHRAGEPYKLLPIDEAAHAQTIAEIMHTAGQPQFAHALITAADLVRSIESETK